MPLHSLPGTWQPSGNLLSPSLSLRWFQPFRPPPPTWHTVKFWSGVKMSSRYSEITGKLNISCWIWLRGCINKARTHTKQGFFFDRRASRARGICCVHTSAVDPHLLQQELKKLIKKKKKKLWCASVQIWRFIYFFSSAFPPFPVRVEVERRLWSQHVAGLKMCDLTNIETVHSHYGARTGLQPHFTFLLDKQSSLHFFFVVVFQNN